MSDTPEQRLEEIRWVDCDVTKQCKSGPITVSGLRHVSKGEGLAVTVGDVLFEFVVTHVHSGMKVAGPFERGVTAVNTLLDLAPLADWTQDGQSVFAEVRRRRASDEKIISAYDGKEVEYSLAFMLATNHIFGDEFPWESKYEGPWAQLAKRDPISPEAR